MRVEIVRINSQYIVLDPQGKQITDRHILDQLSFIQADPTIQSQYVSVKQIKKSIKPNIAHINISTTNT